MGGFVRKCAKPSVFFSLVLIFLIPSAYAQNIPTGQSIGSLTRTAKEEQAKGKISEKLAAKKKENEIKGKKEIAPEKTPAQKEYQKEKVLIKKIVINGVTRFSSKTIKSVTGKYEGKELSLENFNTIAGEITNIYRSKGYVTSTAYLPPQRIKDNTLVIDVIEGKVGNVSIKGNRYFSSRQLLKYLDMKKGEIFNYDTLRQNLNYINEHPDRNASVVLARGADPGESDINVNVKDQLPVHVTLGYDNYNSDYLKNDKYQAEVKMTNLWGLGHIASGEFQMGEEGLFYLYSGRYLMPVTRKLQFGGSYIHIDQKLGGSVKALDIKGRGDVISAFFSYKLISTENFQLTLSPGFEYKDIKNRLLGITISEDNTRIAKIGMDADYTDNFGGRTIITQSFDFGIPYFLGGLGRHDPKASRVGSGGNFFRSVTNAARIQTLPWDLSLMLRGAMQLSSESLVSSEQFNIGGFTTVRGYTVSEFTGDNGFTATGELYIPPYIVPKGIKVPFTETTFYDAFRLIGFFDWGRVDNRSPQVGESKSEALYSLGSGIRFDIPEKLSVAFDWGYCLGQKPSDNDKSKFYISAKMFF